MNTDYHNTVSNDGFLQNLNGLLKEKGISFDQGQFYQVPVVIFLPPAPKKKDVFRQNCSRLGFTIREVEVATGIEKGHTCKDIANELHISPKTVRKHLQNIYFKTNVNKKTELINTLQQDLPQIDKG